VYPNRLLTNSGQMERNFIMLKVSREKVRALFTLSLFAAGVAAHAGGKPVFAMPMFARRLGVPVRPVTRRRPDSTKQDINFARPVIECRRRSERAAKGNHSISSIITAYDSRRATTRPAARTGPDAPHDNNFNLFAAEFYAFTGAWGKYFSSNIKTTIYPEKSYDTEDHLKVEGNIKMTVGNEKRFFEVRAGVLTRWKASARRTSRSQTRAHTYRRTQRTSTRRRSSHPGISINPE